MKEKFLHHSVKPLELNGCYSRDSTITRFYLDFVPFPPALLKV